MVFSGTFAVVELMIGNSVDQTLLTFDELRNCSSLYNDSNVTEFLFQGELTTCDDVRTDVVVTIALLTGIIMVRCLSCGGCENHY